MTKRVTYEVQVQLTFHDLTLQEAHNLEVFMEGLTSRDEWGSPSIIWNLKPTGEKDIKAHKKMVTAKGLLELEKAGARKEKE